MLNEVNNYFIKCIQDSFKCENRKYDISKTNYFFIIVGNQILYELNTPFERVTRRINYRLRNNLFKNFKLDFSGNYFYCTEFSPNFACIKFYVNNKIYYLCKNNIENLNKHGEVFECYRYEELCKNYFNISTKDLKIDVKKFHIPIDINWDEYCRLNLKTFGINPYEYINENIIKTKNVIFV